MNNTQALRPFIAASRPNYFQNNLIEDFVWEFDNYLSTRPHDFFKSLLPRHAILNLKYRALRAILKQKHKNHHLNSGKFDKELTRQHIAVFMMTEILGLLYEYYLPSYQDLKRLQKDRKRYRKILGLGNNDHIPKIASIVEPFDAKIKRLITASSWPRLFVIQLKNALTDLMPLIKQWKDCHHAMNCLNKFADPLITPSGWLVHGLRLIITLVNLVKHTIPGPWMSKHEQKMGWQLRLKSQISFHWSQIINDTLWVISTLAPASMFLTVIIAMFEVFIVALQSMIEINRLQKLLNELAQAVNQKTAAHETKQYLQLSITHEQKKLMLRIITIISVSTLVVLKSLLPILLPALALNPIVPFVIAAMLVVVTLACHLLGKWLERQKPADKLTSEGSKNTSAFTTGFTFFNLEKRHSVSTPKHQLLEMTQVAKQRSLEGNCIHPEARVALL